MTHILACQGHFWCGNSGGANGWAWLMAAGAVIVFILIAVAVAAIRNWE